MKNAKLYLLVGLLTVGNIGFRVANPEHGPDARLVSHVAPGDRVESVEMDRLLADADAAAKPCQMVVAFNPDCPFCNAAAEREALADREGVWAETLWVTDQEWPRLGAFAEKLPPDSRHVVAPVVFEDLDVEAVPALFMIDGEGTVRWVGPYGGDETGEELAGRCAGSSAPPAAGEDVTTLTDG